MNLTFDIREKFGTHTVVLAAVKGKKIFGTPVYASSDRNKVLAVLDALNSGLLSKITTAIMKS